MPNLDPNARADEAEKIRSNMQETIYEMLRERRSVWFG